MYFLWSRICLTISLWQQCNDSHTRLVSVLQIYVKGYEWSVYFACDSGTPQALSGASRAINLFGPIRLGTISTIVGIYALVAYLRHIKE